MANLRILYENQVKRAISIAASTVAGSLVAENLRNDVKTSIHRSSSTTCTYTFLWTNAVNLNMAALAFTNFTAGATIRARVYAEQADSTAIRDSGVVAGCAYAPLGQFSWGLTNLGVNAFRFGGASYARVYFTGSAGKKLTLDVVDTVNPAGFLEAGCAIAGTYWSPDCNPEYGAEMILQYQAQHSRSDFGDLRTERRAKNRGLKMNLNWIKTAADQLQMHSILMQGMETPMWVSLFPEDLNPVLEQRHQIYSKLVGDTSIGHPKFGQFAAPLEVVEI